MPLFALTNINCRKSSKMQQIASELILGNRWRKLSTNSWKINYLHNLNVMQFISRVNINRWLVTCNSNKSSNVWSNDEVIHRTFCTFQTLEKSFCFKITHQQYSEQNFLALITWWETERWVIHSSQTGSVIDCFKLPSPTIPQFYLFNFKVWRVLEFVFGSLLLSNSLFSH